MDVELNLVEVKENLKKAESGPVTLGTTVDTTHLENAAPRVGGGTPAHAGAWAQNLSLLLNGMTNNNVAPYFKTLSIMM